jgi:hypothetical protein
MQESVVEAVVAMVRVWLKECTCPKQLGARCRTRASFGPHSARAYRE